MSDYIYINIDDEYEGESKHSLEDERIGNITAVGVRHDYEPALLASAVLVKVFEHHNSARLTNIPDVQSLEHLVARSLVLAGLSMVATIKHYEPETKG